MPTSQFLNVHSKLIENVLEHGFLFDLSRELLLRPQPAILEINRAEVDWGIDLVLSSGGREHHVQMKGRSNRPAKSAYDISDSLWLKGSGCVIWMIYNPNTMRVIEYYLLGLPLKPNANFAQGKRTGFRKVWTRNANYKKLSIAALANILF